LELRRFIRKPGNEVSEWHAPYSAGQTRGQSAKPRRPRRRRHGRRKIRNTTDAELAHQLHEVNDELFQLKFRLRMGQTESLKKIRSLRRDLARIKTISRERQLGIDNGPKAAEAKPERRQRP